MNLIIKPISIIGIDAEVQNIVGVENYGLYFSILNFTYIFNIVLDFGISNFNTRNVAQHPHLIHRYIGRFISLKTSLFILYCLLTFGISLLFNYEQKHYEILGLLVFNQIIISFIQFFRTYFAGLLLFKYDILLSVLDKFLLIFLAGYFLYFDKESDFTIMLFIECMTLSYIISFFVGSILIGFKIGIPKIRWSSSINFVILKNSFPYALLIFIMTFYNRIDSVLLERLHHNGSYESGVYAQAFRILDAFMMFVMLFTGILFPIFSKMIKQKENIIPLLKTSFTLLFSFTLLISLLCFAFPEVILHAIYDNDVNASIGVFRNLMLSFIFLCCVQLFGTVLTANGDLKKLNIISFLGLVISLTLNLILIPKMGAYGASLVSILTQGLLAIVQIKLVSKKFELKFEFPMLGKLFAFIGFLTAISYLLPKTTVSNNMQFFIVLSFGLILIFILRIVNIREIISILKNKET